MCKESHIQEVKMVASIRSTSNLTLFTVNTLKYTIYITCEM